MNNSVTLAANNLTSVAVLIFVLGFLASRLKSDLRIPEPIFQFISIYLLLAIGLKGGHALKGVVLSEFLTPALVTLALGIIIPVMAFFTLGVIKKLSVVDRGAIAAHYGSTSLVTFSAALLFLENSHIEVEGFATALLTILEIPGVIVGVYLGSRNRKEKVVWHKTLKELLAGKTILLLVGGLIIGAITTPAGYLKVSPLFVDMLNGFLALFLLHLGYLAGSNWKEIKQVGVPMGFFGILFPIASGALGTVVGTWIGLSLGGAAILGVLCASASYIAAPAAVSVALPEANAPLALMSSIGVTFPFNLILGIPIYVELARWLQ